MLRDIQQLSHAKFDLLVIGAGIYGATIACEAAGRGFKTAVIDKHDFGSGTSANSLKIIHGGLRYLQQLDLRRMRTSIRARRQMIQFAPHLIRPLACVMPTHGYGLRSRAMMAGALLANAIISYDRNRDVAPSHHLHAGRLMSPACWEKLFPGLPAGDYSGAAMWYDAIARDTERLTLSYIKQAVASGASAANYVTAEGLLVHGRRAKGVKAVDAITGHAFDIRARYVVNACGPWWHQTIADTIREIDGLRWIKAVNLVCCNPLLGSAAVGLQSRQKFDDHPTRLKHNRRLYFLVPWNNSTLIGTRYQLHQGSPENLSVTSQEIESMLVELNGLLPDPPIGLDDITSVHVGLQPAATSRPVDPDNPQVSNHSILIDHGRRDGLENLFSVIGVKYTTAPVTARFIVNQIIKMLKPSGNCESNPNVPQHAAILPPSDRQLLHDAASVFKEVTPLHQHLHQRYGTEWPRVFRIAEDNAAARAWISHDPPLSAAEVIFAVQEEMALTLPDVVFRRTAIGQANQPQQEVLRATAKIMAGLLNWTSDRIESEIQSVVGRFASPKSIRYSYITR